MRRLISIAAFALLLTVPAFAQRGGGGRAGGGGMRGGGFVARSGGGHIGGGRSFSGIRSSGMRSGPGVSHGFMHSPHNGSWHGTPNHSSHVHHFHNHAFHNNCFGFACQNWAWGSPWWGGWGWGWGGYDPWMWSSWDEQDRRFDEDYYRQYEMAERWNQQSLAEQRMRRQEEEDGDQDAYAQRPSQRRSAPETASQPPEPAVPTILVFRDQHKQEVQNYAIVGQTLWAFSTGRTQKIPLASLDITATEKANDDRGVAFHVPGANEGQ
jgi:hypothetical protein